METPKTRSATKPKPLTLHTMVRRTIKATQDSHKISSLTVDVVVDWLYNFMSRTIEICNAITLNRTSTMKLDVKSVIAAVRCVLVDDEFFSKIQTHADKYLAAAAAAAAKASAAKKAGKPKPDDDVLRPLISVARTKRFVRSFMATTQCSARAVLYLASVQEALVMELMKQAVAVTREHENIKPHHVRRGMNAADHLRNILGGCVVLRGGVDSTLAKRKFAEIDNEAEGDTAIAEPEPEPEPVAAPAPKKSKKSN